MPAATSDIHGVPSKTDAGFNRQCEPDRSPANAWRPRAIIAGFGVQAGYNWRSGRMVAGIEGDFEYASQRGQRDHMP